MSEIEFTPEEFAFLARELREHGDHAPIYKALLSNNYNVILAALDKASEAQTAIALERERCALVVEAYGDEQTPETGEWLANKVRGL